MRAYRWLLRAYPASFREQYGDEMTAAFAREWRRAGSAGARARVASHAMADTLVNAPAVHGDLLRQDLRDAFRSWRRAPGFAAMAVLVSALGIGTATAAFSITDHVLFSPLPFPDAHRLVKVWENHAAAGYSRMELSPPTYRDWKAQATSYTGMAAFTTLSANLSGVGEPGRLEGAIVTGSLFAVLDRQAALGRTLIEADDRLDSPRTVVLSDALWRADFGADPGVLGRVLSLNDEPHVVVGVMPRDFLFPSRDTQFWTPLRFEDESAEDRTNNYLRVVARLAPGRTLADARAEMDHLAATLAREHVAEMEGVGATVVTLRDEVSQQPRLLLAALVGASLCVLLIACTNLANLLLSRALVRQHEMAVRAAIGARLDRLVRQMLTESLTLAAAGGVLGVLLALAAAPLVARLVPNVLPIAETPGLDPRMLAFAAGATVVTGVLFGLLPALRVSRGADATLLREGARAVGGRATRWRSALVVAEITAAVVLLVSSGLLIQALWAVQRVDPGFVARDVLALRTTLPMPRYGETAGRTAFYRAVIDEVEALPGVERAAYISFLPMTMRGGIWPVTLDGEAPGPRSRHSASLRFVTPGFFDAMRIPLAAGRDVAASDTIETPPVAVVSRSFAERHWPGEDPIGRAFHMAFAERIVVGVAGDVRVRGLERESEPQVYLPATQVADGAIPFYAPQDLVVRASVPPASLVPAVRAIVARVDPQQPVSDARPLTDVLEAETAPRLAQLRVLGGFAVLAFLLAGLGIYGLLAFTVAARTREIGVRMALGAGRGRVVAGIVGHAVRLAGIGAVAGIVLAIGAGRALEALLAGVSPTDAPSLVAAVALTFGVTLAGSLLPALRAAHVDPIVAMRDE